MTLEPAHSGSADVDLGVILHESEGLKPAISQERQKVVTKDRLVLDTIHMT